MQREKKTGAALTGRYDLAYRGEYRCGGLLQTPSNTGLGQVVGRHFHFYTITHGQSDPAFAHLSADGRQDEMLVVQFDTKHRSGQHGRDATFKFNMFFFHGLGQIVFFRERDTLPGGKSDAAK